MKKKIFTNKCRVVNNIINGDECDFYVKENNSDLELLDYIISQMDEDSQRIIYFDFVYRNEIYWWREFYSKSTYYRLKNIALDTFLSKTKEFKMYVWLNESG